MCLDAIANVLFLPLFNSFFLDLECKSSHIPGNLFVPPVNTFKYVGRKIHRGIVVDHWAGTIGDSKFDYFTVENNDRPVALFDYDTGFGIFFKEFRLHSNWDPAIWRIPSECS